MAKLNFQHHYSIVTLSSEIIRIRISAQETFLIIINDKKCYTKLLLNIVVENAMHYHSKALTDFQ